MKTMTRTTFTTIKTEGGILPADLLQRIAEGRDLDGLRPEDYHLFPGERLNEAINRAWNRCLGAWQAFDAQRARLPESDRGTSLTRERWLLVLFQELGYGRLQFVGSLALNVESPKSKVQSRLVTPSPSHSITTYPISHLWQQTPIHLVSFRQELDRKGFESRSPHSLMQEFLNRSDDYLWGIVSNGLRLRVLRDNVSLTRAAFVEFDLEAMFTGEHYADFAVLWLVCHQSRVEQDARRPVPGAALPAPGDGGSELKECWLERWSQVATEQGVRALDALREGVQEAISVLGQGFLAHRANTDLRARLKSGALTTRDYYRQLLRVVYRLIFLFVAEDRELLLVPDLTGLGRPVRSMYDKYYSVNRLREMAASLRGGPHADLYQGLRRLFTLLREGYAPLGLPGLGSFLFSAAATPDLDGTELTNAALLEAIRTLTLTTEGSVRRSIDYRNLGSEELGSVYESLLELHPQLNVDAATFTLAVVAGSERKTTGSHYTATPLIQELLDSALEPVVADRLARVKREGQVSGFMFNDAEAALLSIKLIDPACGSGHFLIAAAHRLAHHLARIRTGDAEPSPADLRAALRDVVRHCIYGVDINPMAVELCKVALWMETLDPGKPLSFLERNIQCGNSLFGTTPALLHAGIPDEAFEPLTGDDKDVCREARQQNKRERSGQLSLFRPDLQPWEQLGNLAEGILALDAPEETLDDVRQKQAAYEELVRSAGYRFGQLRADAWCAAFVWPKDKAMPYALTEEAFRRLERNPYDVPQWMAETIARLRERYTFFHWHLAYPGVFIPKPREALEDDEEDITGWEGGFDVVVGNPPWEKVQLEEKQFFEQHRSDITTATSAKRRKLLQELAQTDPVLWQTWQEALRNSEGMVHFLKSGRRFPLSSRGNINTYSLFLELSTQLMAPISRIGMIVPSGIATDDTTKFFFHDLMNTGALVSLYDFENREGLFPDVDSRMKFCLLTLTEQSYSVQSAEFVFFAHRISDLEEPERRFSLTAAEIAVLNPNTHTCPTFRSKREASVVKKIYQQLPILAVDDGESSGWKCQSKQMLNITHDSESFIDKDTIQKMSGKFVPSGDFIEESGVKWLRLYEGKMAGLYDHRQASVSYRADVSYRTTSTDETSLENHTDPIFTVSPQFWVSEQRVLQAIPDWYTYHWFVAFKRIASSTNERTVIACIAPWAGLIDAIPAVYIDHPAIMGVYLLANLNAFVFDFVARTKVGGLQVSHFILKQLPVVPPQMYSKVLPGVEKELGSFVGKRVLELTYTAWDLRPFAQDCGYDGPPFVWDEERRFLLRCELDAAYFHLYGIARDDVDYIMETFPIVKRKDEAAYGEYRTKRVILEMYDEMAEGAYQTRLDPPPADPRVAHTGEPPAYLREL